MSVLDLLRKGFGFVLLSMGVSSPAGKSRPPAASTPAGPAPPETKKRNR